MPIYEYRCTECGFQKEYLQKVSDPRLTECPSCGKNTFSKMVTAAGFQLKGSGWYVTDFKNAGSGNAAKAGGKDESAAAGSEGGDRKAESAGSKSGASSESGDSKSADSKSGDSKSGDSKSADSKSADSKSRDSKSTESKSAPASESKSETKASTPRPAASGS